MEIHKVINLNTGRHKLIKFQSTKLMLMLMHAYNIPTYVNPSLCMKCFVRTTVNSQATSK